MPKRRKYETNLGIYAQKRKRKDSPEKQVTTPQPIPIQEDIVKQEFKTVYDSEDELPESTVASQSDGYESILEDDNDLPYDWPSETAFLQWLNAKKEAAEEMIKKAAALTEANARKDGKRGTYATKANGKPPAKRTEQHRALEAKRKADGCLKITNFFKPQTKLHEVIDDGSIVEQPTSQHEPTESVEAPQSLAWIVREGLNAPATSVEDLTTPRLHARPEEIPTTTIPRSR